MFTISIHSLHTEGDVQLANTIVQVTIFQSTPSTRRETRETLHVINDYILFQSTPSTRRETQNLASAFMDLTFQSTPSTRRETSGTLHSATYREISIHSLHTEGDSRISCRMLGFRNFNPLPPHGGRLGCKNLESVTLPFQSTPSTRRETVRTDYYLTVRKISIHSLHTEGDRPLTGYPDGDRIFQSTPSTRRETLIIRRIFAASVFQSTPSTRRETFLQLQFSTHKPFQSTPSTRRETLVPYQIAEQLVISIHSLHTEGDSGIRNITFPHCISIHSLHTEGDRRCIFCLR